MGRFFGWKLRKHINIPNFYSGQYHQTIFHDTYFSDCIFSFICWQKSSILRISSKKFLSSKVFEDFSKFRRIFVFGLFSEPEDSSSSSSVHFWSSLQHCNGLKKASADQDQKPSWIMIKVMILLHLNCLKEHQCDDTLLLLPLPRQ